MHFWLIFHLQMIKCVYVVMVNYIIKLQAGRCLQPVVYEVYSECVFACINIPCHAETCFAHMTHVCLCWWIVCRSISPQEWKRTCGFEERVGEREALCPQAEGQMVYWEARWIRGSRVGRLSMGRSVGSRYRLELSHIPHWSDLQLDTLPQHQRERERERGESRRGREEGEGEGGRGRGRGELGGRRERREERGLRIFWRRGYFLGERENLERGSIYSPERVPSLKRRGRRSRPGVMRDALWGNAAYIKQSVSSVRMSLCLETRVLKQEERNLRKESRSPSKKHLALGGRSLLIIWVQRKYFCIGLLEAVRNMWNNIKLK